MSKRIDFFKITIGSCKFMKLAIFANKLMRTVLTDLIYLTDLASTRYFMSITVSICQHCDEQHFQTLSCVHESLSSKVRFIYTSTVTGSDSCSGKTTRTPSVHLVTNCENFAIKCFSDR